MAVDLGAARENGGGAGDKAETRRETAGLHVRRAKSQSASGKAWEALGGARVFLGRRRGTADSRAPVPVHT